jgi:hypothetical protein
MLARYLPSLRFTSSKLSRLIFFVGVFFSAAKAWPFVSARVTSSGSFFSSGCVSDAPVPLLFFLVEDATEGRLSVKDLVASCDLEGGLGVVSGS